MDLIFLKLRVRIKDNYEMSCGKFDKFLDLNFAPYVFCIFPYKLYNVTNTEPGFIVVTNPRVFLLCDFIGSSLPRNRVQDQGSIRVYKRSSSPTWSYAQDQE